LFKNNLPALSILHMKFGKNEELFCSIEAMYRDFFGGDSPLYIKKNIGEEKEKILKIAYERLECNASLEQLTTEPDSKIFSADKLICVELLDVSEFANGRESWAVGSNNAEIEKKVAKNHPYWRTGFRTEEEAKREAYELLNQE